MGDAYIVRRGGGSGGLSFKVITSTRQPAQPSNINRNLIWIDTSVKAPIWYMQPTEPSAIEDGTVWIKTSLNMPNAFNILTKNVIVLGIESLHQYTSANRKWNVMPGGIFSNGVWHLYSSISYLYNRGVYYTDFAGTLQTKKWPEQPAYAGATPTVTNQDATITIKQQRGSNISGIAYFDKMIDLSKYKNIGFEGSISLTGTSVNNPVRYASVCAWSSLDGNTSGRDLLVTGTPSSLNTVETVRIPITSEAAKNAYIGFRVTNADSTIVVHRLWLEPK